LGGIAEISPESLSGTDHPQNVFGHLRAAIIVRADDATDDSMKGASSLLARGKMQSKELLAAGAYSRCYVCSRQELARP
jgi:hypothetical protein